MSDSRPISATGNNNKSRVIVDWTQVPDDAIRYDTDNKEEVMKAKSKERKRQKAAEQAQHEEQVWLEAERVAREQVEAERAEWERVEAERIVQETKEQRACEEGEKRKAEEEKEAERKHKAETGKSSEARGEVKRVVMDPGCTCCTRANTICKFLVDGNKKQVACIRCNQSKGKCQWPGDGKDAEAGSKAGRSDKGKKRKANKENAEAGPSMQKRLRTSARLAKVLDLDELEASRSGVKEASAARYSGLENKLDLFELHETAVENLGHIADVPESILDKSYSVGMVVSPSDSGSSELDSDELHEEAEWLKDHGEYEEESEGEDESMAK
ncbi:hypothetical protein M404DRAFT_25342 [Pisolithus tinctorius Marx 270]|uniref:Uncharacterized protein n=1 Tax=Pisolithus tinctorius Marx 270 TaxID=870435 RepID=A0A0C3PC80_PISTI|nr:hypothetical protein M404DRAFT_25342 [Pisolithus tinctorius Marx 270]